MDLKGFGTRPAEREYVRSLEKRVKELEKRLCPGMHIFGPTGDTCQCGKEKW